MTSATGRRAGFTMIELLIVISLIVVLLTMFVVGMQSVKKKMRVSSTQSLIERVEIALESYNAKRGRYPSDGIEDRVETEDGTSMQSGAALTYLMTRPFPITRIDQAGRETVVGTSEALLEIKESELSEPLDDDSDAVELEDSWGNALHYDNLSGKNGRFDAQGEGDVHLHEVDAHGPDPRETEFVAREGAQNSGKFDLWSHGLLGHTDQAKTQVMLGNFKLIGVGEDDSSD